MSDDPIKALNTRLDALAFILENAHARAIAELAAQLKRQGQRIAELEAVVGIERAPPQVQ